MKHLLSIVAFIATMTLVACEEPTTQPTPPEDDTTQYQPETYPEGTYHFTGQLAAKRQVLETNGLRNDYISFYDEDSGDALYIDFYSESGNEELASGKYELGDGTQAMTFDQQYTYMKFSGSDDLHRFAEGSVCVAVDMEHESGYPWYHFTAYLTMSNGESVSLDYEGQVGTMPQIGNL
jgi:hypothetical protein